MLCDDDVEADDYFGLDSNRDTEAEVETALRFFPELLSRRKKATHGYRFYPVELLAYTRSGSNIWKCNLKAVSFVPLVVRLAIEFDLFEEQERGGLLIGDKYHVNMLQLLSSANTMAVARDRENHELIDDAHLNVMVQLRQVGHFQKEDIYIHGLLMRMCHQSIFPRKRFQFLVEWYPFVLIRPDEFGYVPLHRAVSMSSIHASQAVFEYGIRYYPKKKGISLLFMKDNNGKTPIQIAFMKTKLRGKVMKITEDVLTRYSSSSSDNNNTSINTVEALVMAAIDENIHLDCVYFLLRRQPDVLVELLSSTPTPGEAVGSNNNNNNNNEDDDDNDDNDYDDGGDERNDGNNDILVRRTLSSNMKRKRKL